MSKEAVQSAKKVDPKRLHMLVVLSIIAISHFLPPVGQMTTAGIRYLYCRNLRLDFC